MECIWRCTIPDCIEIKILIRKKSNLKFILTHECIISIALMFSQVPALFAKNQIRLHLNSTSFQICTSVKILEVQNNQVLIQAPSSLRKVWWNLRSQALYEPRQRWVATWIWVQTRARTLLHTLVGGGWRSTSFLTTCELGAIYFCFLYIYSRYKYNISYHFNYNRCYTVTSTTAVDIFAEVTLVAIFIIVARYAEQKKLFTSSLLLVPRRSMS